MPSYDEFNEWLLSQLKDPDLLQRAKKRMKKSVVWDVSDVEGSVISKEDEEASFSHGQKKDESKDEKGNELRKTNHQPGSKAQEESVEAYIKNRTYEPDGFWLEKLFSSRASRLSKETLLNHSTNHIYEHLANFANMLAHHKRNPWQRIGEEEARFDGVFLSPVLMQRIYYYGRDLVLSHYNPEEVETGTSSYLHYFDHAFGRKRAGILIDLGKQLVQSLPEIDAATYEYFGYTSRGEKRVWWDMDGSIRRKYPMTEKQVNRYQVEPLRTTFIWDLEPMKIRILAMFNEVCDYLEVLIAQGEENWRNLAMKRYILSVVSGDKNHNNPKRYDLMGILLRRCEMVVRDSVEGFPQLTASDDEEELRRRLPQPIRDPLKAFLETYKVPKLEVDELAIVCNETRYGVKVANAWLDDRTFDEKEVLRLLDQLDEKTANRILVHQGHRLSDNLQRLNVFLQWRKNKKLIKIQKHDVDKLFNQSQYSRLEEWIQTEAFPEGLSAFRDKFLQEEEVRRTLLNRENLGKKLYHEDLWASYVSLILQALQKPRFRKVKLDFDKVNASRVSLAKTVELVDDFIQRHEKQEVLQTPEEFVEEKSVEKPAEEPEEKAASGSLWTSTEQSFLLALLASQDGLSQTQVEDFAKDAGLSETVFLGQINDKAYDDIGAELVFLEGGRVIVDDWDKDWLRDSVETKER